MKLVGFQHITAVVHCDSGLRIGGGKENLDIGGQENPIIRHPITDLPYIPGSSIKGKLRSLLELRLCPRTQQTGNPCDCGSCPVCRIFGSGSIRTGNEPTRLLARDCPLTEASEQTLLDAQRERGLNHAEVKSEVRIDRKTGRAAGGALRTQERVPEGTEFQLRIDLRVFENDPKEDFTKLVLQGLALMEQDALGSSGSRGYGKISLSDLKVNGQPVNLKET